MRTKLKNKVRSITLMKATDLSIVTGTNGFTKGSVNKLSEHEDYRIYLSEIRSIL